MSYKLPALAFDHLWRVTPMSTKIVHMFAFQTGTVFVFLSLPSPVLVFLSLFFKPLYISCCGCVPPRLSASAGLNHPISAAIHEQY